MNEEEGEDIGADREILSQAREISGGVFTTGVYSEPVLPVLMRRSVHNRENISPPISPPKSHPSRTRNGVSDKGPTKFPNSCLEGVVCNDTNSPTTSRNRAGSAIHRRDIQSHGTEDLGLEYRKTMALERHKRRNLKMQMRGLTTDISVTSTSPSVNPSTFNQCQKTALPSRESKGCTATVGRPFSFADPDPSFATRKLHYVKLSPEARRHLCTVCLSLVSTRCKADFIRKTRAFALLRTRTSIAPTRTAESFAPSRELGCLRLMYSLEQIGRRWKERRLKVAMQTMSRNVVLRNQDKHFVLECLVRVTSERLQRKKLRALLGWRMVCFHDISRNAKDELSIVRKDYLEKEKAVHHRYSRSLRSTLGIYRAFELSWRFKLRIQASAFHVWQRHCMRSNQVASALKTCFDHCLAIQRRRALAQWREKVYRKTVGRVVLSHLARLADATRKDNMYRVMLRWKVRCLSVDKLLLSMARKNPLRRHEEFSWLCVLSATRMQAVKLMQEASMVPTPKGRAVKGSFGTRGNGDDDGNLNVAGRSSCVQDSEEDGDGTAPHPIPSSSEIKASAMMLSQSLASNDGLRAQLSLAVSTAASSVEIFPGLPPHERGDVIMTPSTSRLTPMLHPMEGGGSDFSDLGYSISPTSDAISFFKLSANGGSKRGECSPPDRLYSGATSRNNNSGIDMQQSSNSSDPSFMHPSPPHPEDGKLLGNNIVSLSPPTQRQQWELFHHWAVEEHEPEHSLSASTSSFLQVSSCSSSAVLQEQSSLMAVGPSPSSPENGGTSGKSLFPVSPALTHSSKQHQPTLNKEKKLLMGHSTNTVDPNTSPDYSPDDASTSVIPQLLTTNPLSRPHEIDNEKARATATVSPALQVQEKNRDGIISTLAMIPCTPQMGVNVSNVMEEPISPPRGGGSHYHDSEFVLSAEDHSGNLSAAEKGTSRPLQYDSDDYSNTNVIACTESATAASQPLLNVRHCPFKRMTNEVGGSNGPRWYSTVNSVMEKQDGGNTNVHPHKQEVTSNFTSSHELALSVAKVTADSAVEQPVIMRNEQNGMLREDTTQYSYAMNVESPPQQQIPIVSERSSYPYQRPYLNHHHQLNEGVGHANQAMMQDPQVSLSCCEKIVPKQLQLPSQMVIPSPHVISPDRARNELKYDDNTRDAAPLLLLQPSESARLSHHTSGHEQPPQRQTGYSAAALVHPEHEHSSLVAHLPEYECDGIEVQPTVPQHQHGGSSALFNDDNRGDDFHYQCMVNPDPGSPSTLPRPPPQCGPFQSPSNMVVEVQNNPRMGNCINEQRHNQGIGVLKQQEEYHHPERRNDVVGNNKTPSSTVHEPQYYYPRRDYDEHHRRQGVSNLEDDCHERRRYPVDNNHLTLSQGQPRYDQPPPRRGHEQHTRRRTPKSEQQYHQERGNNVVVACNPNNPPLAAQKEQFYHCHYPSRSHRYDYGTYGGVPEPDEYTERRFAVIDNDLLMAQEQYHHDGPPMRNDDHTIQGTVATEPQPECHHDKRCTGHNNPVPPAVAQEQQQQYYPKIINHTKHSIRSYPEKQPEEYYPETRRFVTAVDDYDLPVVAQEQYHHGRKRNIEHSIQGVITDPSEYHGMRYVTRNQDNNNNNLSPLEEEERCYHSRKNTHDEPRHAGCQIFTEQPDDEYLYPERRFVIVGGGDFPTMQEEQEYHHRKKNLEPQPQPHGVMTGPSEYHDHIPAERKEQQQKYNEKNYDGRYAQTQRCPESATQYSERKYVVRGKSVPRSGIRPTPPPIDDRFGGKGFSRTTGMQQRHQQQQRRNIVHEGSTVQYDMDRMEGDGGGEWVAEDVRGDSEIMQQHTTTNMNPSVAPCRPRQGKPCEGIRQSGRRRYPRGPPSQKNSNAGNAGFYRHIRNKGRHSSSGVRNGQQQRNYSNGQLEGIEDEAAESQYFVCDNDLESEESTSSLSLTPACGNTCEMKVAADAVPDYEQSDRDIAKTLHAKLNALESGLEHVEASISTSAPHLSSLSKKNSKEIQQRLSAVEMAVDGLRKGTARGHHYSPASPELMLHEHGNGASAAAAADVNHDYGHSSNVIGLVGWTSDVKDIRKRLKKARSRLEALQMEAETFSSETTPSLKNHVLRNQRHRLNSALNMALGSSYT